MGTLRTVERGEHEMVKRQIAAKAKWKIHNARALLGPATSYCCWHLKDVEKVEPERIVYACQRNGEGWRPSAMEAFGELLERRSDTRFFEFQGRQVFYMRYELRFEFLADYNPKSQAELDAARAKRNAKAYQKKIDDERAHLALFVDQLEE